MGTQVCFSDSVLPLRGEQLPAAGPEDLPPPPKHTAQDAYVFVTPWVPAASSL